MRSSTINRVFTILVTAIISLYVFADEVPEEGGEPLGT